MSIIGKFIKKKKERKIRETSEKEQELFDDVVYDREEDKEEEELLRNIEQWGKTPPFSKKRLQQTQIQPKPTVIEEKKDIRTKVNPCPSIFSIIVGSYSLGKT